MPSQRSHITGSIVDFGGFYRQHEWHPELHMLAPRTAGAIEGFLSSVDAPIRLSEYMTFDFHAIASEDIYPPTPVSFRLRWLDAANNFVSEDYWENVWLPPGDWSMGTLLRQKGVGTNQVIWQEPEPLEKLVPFGALWVNTETGDVLRRRG